MRAGRCVCYGVLQWVAVGCSVLQCVAVCCSYMEARGDFVETHGKSLCGAMGCHLCVCVFTQTETVFVSELSSLCLSTKTLCCVSI